MSEKTNESVSFGEDAYQEEAKRQAELAAQRESNRVASLKTFSMSLKEGEIRSVVFLSTEFAMVKTHEYKVFKDGKERFETLFCLNSETHECPKCKEGDVPKSKVLCVLLDLTPWTDKQGNKFTAGTIKPYLRPFGDGQKILRLFNGSLTGEAITNDEVINTVFKITRDGTGTSTSYSYIHVPSIPITKEQRERIKEFLDKYPNPKDYLIRWVQERYKDVIKPRVNTEDNHTELSQEDQSKMDRLVESGAISTDDLPF